ncbi:hypothetical protein H920_20121 [Fukomys damarensis]|uniref:Uncharacterized protein n=1 Tax=Fukomys damarensis TaxID=885580 RepID=A0A091D6F7_FUKDA|nr:hypothetical protein H920_20121 [Fukomys damarensis]
MTQPSISEKQYSREPWTWGSRWQRRLQYRLYELFLGASKSSGPSPPARTQGKADFQSGREVRPDQVLPSPMLIICQQTPDYWGLLSLLNIEDT